MKQKIVMKVQMNCQKCRTKALEVAAVEGADSVAIEGKEKELVVVIGEGVDAVSLASLMRKKVGHTELVSVNEVKKKDEKKEKEIEFEVKKKDEKKEKNIGFEYTVPPQWIPNFHPYPPQFTTYEVVYDKNPDSCSIM
ncbi:disease resistance protein Pik-1-like [Tasmannia lanceolata]|uniref:disease resistance protein Pik-1-like n=1 Tax=Tasmannia lanceolata TaxID=3420 RepID=UPI0040632FFF